MIDLFLRWWLFVRRYTRSRPVCRDVRNPYVLFPAVCLAVVLLIAAFASIQAQAAEIKVLPSSAAPESDLTVSGAGFMPEYTVIVSIDGEEWGKTEVSPNGTFSLTLPVPSLSPGVYSVTADDGEVSALARFRVPQEEVPSSPRISVAPSSGLPGSTITLEGSGFKPFSGVTVTMDETEIADIEADTEGTFSTSALVPGLPPGMKPVIANPGQAVAEFNVLASPQESPRTGIPDLAIMSAEYRFEEDSRVLVFSVEVINQGDAETGDTQVLISDESRVFSPAYGSLRGLLPQEAVAPGIWLEIPGDEYGTTHSFLIEVDPESQIADRNRDNNSRIMEISLPEPETGPNAEPEEEPEMESEVGPEVEPDLESPQPGLPWPWIAVIPAAAAGAAGFCLKKRLDKRKVRLPKDIEIRARSALRNHRIDSDKPVRLDHEIRLSIIADPGKQYIEPGKIQVVDEQKEKTE
ncbi:MAG: hypothetical protein JXA46_10525 [Dehalococcoidales bacterium]|nr:hypothetical protein [Dehalococcoidales bacterium]